MNSTNQDIELFFEDPNEYHNPPRQFSVLYLLLRDISYCIGENQNEGKAIFPAIMGILAGIDLLAKFFVGNDGRGVGPRFKSYVNKYFELDNENDATIIYQLRNALLHSFGLYSEDSNNVYHFRLSKNHNVLIEEQPDNYYQIDVQILYKKFKQSINEYYKDLCDDKDNLRQNFTNMFHKYGKIYIG